MNCVLYRFTHLLKPKSEFTKGTILEVCKEPRSYLVKCPSGVYRRNRKFIKYNPNEQDVPNVIISKPILRKTSSCVVVPPTRLCISVSNKPRYYTDCSESEKTLEDSMTHLTTSSDETSLTPTNSLLDESQSYDQSTVNNSLFGHTTVFSNADSEDSVSESDGSDESLLGACALPQSPVTPPYPSEDAEPPDDMEEDRPRRDRRPVKRFTFSDYDH